MSIRSYYADVSYLNDYAVHVVCSNEAYYYNIVETLPKGTQYSWAFPRLVLLFFPLMPLLVGGDWKSDEDERLKSEGHPPNATHLSVPFSLPRGHRGLQHNVSGIAIDYKQNVEGKKKICTSNKRNAYKEYDRTLRI